jgi:hypothetical protein
VLAGAELVGAGLVEVVLEGSVVAGVVVEEVVVEDGLVDRRLGWLLVDASPTSSGWHDASRREAGRATPIWIKRRRVTQVRRDSSKSGRILLPRPVSPEWRTKIGSQVQPAVLPWGRSLVPTWGPLSFVARVSMLRASRGEAFSQQAGGDDI